MKLQQHRRQVKPHEIRKRSDYTKEVTNTIKVPGEREPTKTGYKVSSFKNNSFETFYEVMLAGTSTDRVRHYTKDKVIWVVAGQGVLELQGAAGRVLVPGDHVVIERGDSARITTTGQQTLEMLVTQQTKYDAKLETTEETLVERVATEQDLAEPTTQERMAGVVDFAPRRGSKAVEQQTAERASRGRVGGGRPPIDGTQDPARMGFQAGKNARPTNGKFSDSGAG